MWIFARWGHLRLWLKCPMFTLHGPTVSAVPLARPQFMTSAAMCRRTSQVLHRNFKRLRFSHFYVVVDNQKNCMMNCLIYIILYDSLTFLDKIWWNHVSFLAGIQFSGICISCSDMNGAGHWAKTDMDDWVINLTRQRTALRLHALLKGMYSYIYIYIYTRTCACMYIMYTYLQIYIYICKIY